MLLKPTICPLFDIKMYHLKEPKFDKENRLTLECMIQAFNNWALKPSFDLIDWT